MFILVGPGNVTTGLHLFSYELSKGSSIVPGLNGLETIGGVTEGLDIHISRGRKREWCLIKVGRYTKFLYWWYLEVSNRTKQTICFCEKCA